MKTMKRRWMVRGLKFVILVMIVIAAFGQAVLHLWNLLMPAIFGLQTISFWQAIGLMALSWLLFGGLRGFPGGGYSGRWRHRMAERWEQMTPEERERFRHGLHRRCGS